MHIGRGTSESKTECVFSPPPQFVQRLERTNTEATTIQRAFRRTHHAHSRCIATEETPQDRQALPPTIATNLLSPTSFPIGCRVTVTPSKHKPYTNTNGTVTRHTAKFVEFVPDNVIPTQHVMGSLCGSCSRGTYSTAHHGASYSGFYS